VDDNEGVTDDVKDEGTQDNNPLDWWDTGNSDSIGFPYFMPFSLGSLLWWWDTGNSISSIPYSLPFELGQ
jgi:hypothetical protein